MATRIQVKSRTTKRPQATSDYSTGGASNTWTGGKPPRLDPRGFPAVPVGVPTNIVTVTTVA